MAVDRPVDRDALVGTRRVEGEEPEVARPVRSDGQDQGRGAADRGERHAGAPQQDENRRWEEADRLPDLADPPLLALLREQIAGKAPEAYVFTGPTGKPLRIGNFRKWGWTPALKEAGLKGLRIHDLRHTHVAWLIDAGEQMYEISKRLGHKKVSFTLDRYGHLMPERGRRTADALTRWAEQNDQRISRLP